MIIGTDASIKECKDMGYLMAEYDGRVPFDHKVDIEFIEYLPKYIREQSHLTLEDAKRWTRLDTTELWEEYERRKKAIQRCCDYHIERIEDIKTYDDALLLADAINGYCGIFD